MAIRKTKNGFQVDITVQGERIREKYPTQLQAEARNSEILLAVEEGRDIPYKHHSNNPIHNFKQLVEALCRREDYNLKETQTCHRVAKFMGEKISISNINTYKIDEMVARLKHRGRGNATINRYMAKVSKALNYAIELGIIEKKPIIKFYKEGVGRIRSLTQDEEKGLIEFLKPLNRYYLDFCLFALDTGMRRGEILKMEYKNYHNGSVTIYETKNNTNRTIPLTQRAQEILQRNKSFKFKNHEMRSWWDRVKCYLNLQEDEEFVFHCLRHSCASRLVRKKVPIQVVKDWLGHKSLSVTLRYAHLSQENLEEARDALEQKTEVVTFPVTKRAY